MNPFQVDWAQEAEDALALFWMQRRSDRRTINYAQVEIDKLLALDPVKHGSHLSEGLYRIEVSPLRALYSIDQAGHRVEVVKVSWIG